MQTSHLLQAGFLGQAVSVSMIAAGERSNDLVDPTRPLGILSSTREVESDLVLTSVWIGKDSRVAIINGERVFVNQMIDGAEVVSIQPGRVILRRGNSSEELKVHQDNFKRPANLQPENKLKM